MSATLLMLVEPLIELTLRAFQPAVQFNHRVRSRHVPVRQEQRLRQLFEPIELDVGDMYAVYVRSEQHPLAPRDGPNRRARACPRPPLAQRPLAPRARLPCFRRAPARKSIRRRRCEARAMRIAPLRACRVAAVVAMAMVWGPFYPPAHAIAALMLFLSMWATRNGLAHFYRAPPKAGTQLLDRIGPLLKWTLLLSICARAAAQDAAQSGGFGGDLGKAAPGTIASLFAWVVFHLCAAHRALGWRRVACTPVAASVRVCARV
eukprot:6398461-Prymnesium_polylepis.1